MIPRICRPFLGSPLPDSNRRPLPYHDRNANPLTGASGQQARGETDPNPTDRIRPNRTVSAPFGPRHRARGPIEAERATDMRTADMAVAFAEQRRGRDPTRSREGVS